VGDREMIVARVMIYGHYTLKKKSSSDGQD
jgi:hypothetical protein